MDRGKFPAARAADEPLPRTETTKRLYAKRGDLDIASWTDSRCWIEALAPLRQRPFAVGACEASLLYHFQLRGSTGIVRGQATPVLDALEATQTSLPQKADGSCNVRPAALEPHVVGPRR